MWPSCWGAECFAFTMYFAEIGESVQQQGQLDFVTGTLNRRAIEGHADGGDCTEQPNA